MKATPDPQLAEIEAALADAELDDSDVPLVEAAEVRLDGIFKAKADLNSALIQMDIQLMQRWLRYVFEMRYAVRAHPFWASAEYGRGLTRRAEKLFEHYEQTDFSKLEEELKTTEVVFGFEVFLALVASGTADRVGALNPTDLG